MRHWACMKKCYPFSSVILNEVAELLPLSFCHCLFPVPLSFDCAHLQDCLQYKRSFWRSLQQNAELVLNPAFRSQIAQLLHETNVNNCMTVLLAGALANQLSDLNALTQTAQGSSAARFAEDSALADKTQQLMVSLILKSFKTSQLDKTGLVPHKPATCARVCTVYISVYQFALLLLLLLMQARRCANADLVSALQNVIGV